MVAFESLYLTVPLVVSGLLVACAGRDLHHFVIKATGFLVGFVLVLVVFAGPRIGTAWAEGDLLGFLGTLVIGLGISYVAGMITLSIAWAVYVFSVMFPGFVGGGFAGIAITGPPGGIFELAIVFVLAVAGGMLLWVLHELFLVVWTAFIGAVMVSLGLTGARLAGLPILRRPALLIEDPYAAIVDTIAALDLFVPAIVVVFLVGLVVQWGLLPAQSAES